jgi:hypothetical protein
MGSLSSYGGKLSNFGNTGGAPAAATPDGIDELILAMGGWKTNGVSTITPSIVMSRPSNGVDTPAMWVAPCAVHFDASDTTDTDTTRPWHDCLYYWDYGDSAQENEYWPYGSQAGTKSKNHDIGPIGGHVYENPGTYTVTLTVLNALGDIATTTQTITITDPDVIFAGTNTIVVSSSGNFDGKPEGALEVTKSDYRLVWANDVASGKRVMLRCGDEFSYSTAMIYKADAFNYQVCSFGAGPKPIVNALVGGESIASVTPIRGLYSGSYNIQIYDIEFKNPNLLNVPGPGVSLTNSNNTISTNYESGLVTFLNLTASNMNVAVMGGYGCAVINCTGGSPASISGIVGMWGGHVNKPIYLGNFVDMGNTAADVTHGEHVARMQGHYKAMIAHNHLARPNATKHALAMRGFNYKTQAIAWASERTYTLAGDLLAPGNGFVYHLYKINSVADRKTGLVEPTWPTTIGATVTDGGCNWRCEYVDSLPYYYVSGTSSVYDNFFDMEGAPGSSYTTQIHPASDSNDYEVMDTYFWYANRYSKQTVLDGTSQIKLLIRGSNVTARNNIFDCSALDGGMRAIFVMGGGGTVGLPTPVNCVVENNTIYSKFLGTGTPTFKAIEFNSAISSGHVARNNLMYAPGQGVASETVVDATTTATISNNSTLDQMLNGPNPFVVAEPSAPADFKLKSDSYAKGTAANIVSAYLDFFGTARDRRSVDMGAISKDS